MIFKFYVPENPYFIAVKKLFHLLTWSRKCRLKNKIIFPCFPLLLSFHSSVSLNPLVSFLQVFPSLFRFTPCIPVPCFSFACIPVPCFPSASIPVPCFPSASIPVPYFHSASIPVPCFISASIAVPVYLLLVFQSPVSHLLVFLSPVYFYSWHISLLFPFG